MATFNVRYASNRRFIKTGAEIAQILRKAATRIEGMKFSSASLDHAENLEDAGFEGRLGLRGFLDPKSD
jgi:hypothetical protein